MKDKFVRRVSVCLYDVLLEVGNPVLDSINAGGKCDFEDDFGQGRML